MVKIYRHFLGCTAILLLAGSLRAQVISLAVKQADVKQVFLLIEKQAKVSFVYNENTLKGLGPVTVSAQQAPLAEVLKNISSQLPLLFKQSGTVIGVSGTPKKTISGRVADSTGKPLAGVSVSARERKAITRADGTFAIEADPGDDITVTAIGFNVYAFRVTDSPAFKDIVLSSAAGSLTEVNIVSNGYQNIPKERATGSFVQLDNELLNRSVSTNILDRLNGVASGLIFNNNGAHQFAQANIEVRGRATLFSNPNPLIILDNFPYDGDLNNINPNDVESITILKDASAASAWGSRSGNGVIVVTTKKGSLNTPARVSFSANTTVGAKPDLYYTPQVSSADYIGVEQFLFNKGAYNTTISNGYSPLSPAVQIFLARRNGSISAADSLAQINTLKGYDIRKQLLQYFYRPSVNQQYQAGLSGGSAAQKYFVSAGYDKNLNNAVNSSYDRVTLNASNTYYLLHNKLELFSNIIYTNSETGSGPVYTGNYPYNQIADAGGNPLPVANTLRLSYASSAGNGKLLNWLYSPLAELDNGYSHTAADLTDYRLNLSVSYKIMPGLQASVRYAYEKGLTETNNLNELQSYYTRNLINTYTQINAATGAVSYPVPLGGIFNKSQTDISSSDGRFQLNYEKTIGKHGINAVVGTEIDDYNSLNSNYTLFGYNPETGTNLNSAMNFTALFPNFYSTGTSRISPNTSQTGATNRFVSEYFNASYAYDQRYIISLSGRRDESNLFGVAENQKGIPLWSAGLSWVINKEDFYRSAWLPQLKIRATYGYTGNVNTSVSALLTAQAAPLASTYNVPSSQIVNPPNPSLRWENDQNVNIGIDFEIRNGRLSGSIDYWRKKGNDLIGNSPIAPQTGISLFTGNSASTLTNGVDVQLNSVNLTGKIRWLTVFLYNYTHSKVTAYNVSNGTNLNVVSANYNNPLQGYPYYAIFSFKYAGLNATGDPQGYINGQVSNNYSGILNSTNRSELVYSGSATPTSFGSLRNTFLYKAFDLSFNITYKLGYYFRRPSLNNGIIYGTGGGAYLTADYDKRWQKPGDELTTNVPALVYPSSTPRSNLYTYSDALVEKADHVRFQDLRIGYTLTGKSAGIFQSLNVFTYLSNIALLWRANHAGIDPDYPIGIPVSRTIAFGIKGNLK